MSVDSIRVLHVATLVSPDGAYGGPIRVALNQCTTLHASGHSPRLAAAFRGYPTAPNTLSGIETRLFRARDVIPRIGFAGLGAPSMVPWFLRHRREFDVVHVHLARDLVTLPIAAMSAWSGVPTVVQPHGMIDPSERLSAKPLDLALTGPTLRRASRVLFLTERERIDLGRVAGRTIRLEHLGNGVPPSTHIDGVRARRIAAHTPEVLFLARLHPRKRATTFVHAAIELLADGTDATFAVVGPDEGDGALVDELIRSSPFAERIRREGALDPDATRERMARADVYVLPSVDEPFPMSVLEAMSEALPVVITDTCGLAPLVRSSACGVVVDDTRDQLVSAIRRFIDDRDFRISTGENALRTSRTELSMDAVGSGLERIYRAAMSGDRRDR